MSTPLKLVIFDVDGTLVDSQAEIVGCMAAAFEAVSVPPPGRPATLSIVGLSLPNAMSVLAPDADSETQMRLVDAYRSEFGQRRAAGSARNMPLYPGALEALRAIHAEPTWLLGVATGKSRRGVNALIEAHGLDGLFQTVQVADDHPSKPHPSMIETALAETGVAAEDAVMIGDTRFDMEMAHAANVPFIGVDWGYHAAETLTKSVAVLSDFEMLLPAVHRLWSGDR